MEPGGLGAQAALWLGRRRTLHRVVPVRAAVAAQARLPSRHEARASMDFLLGASARAGEIDELADAYRRYELLRAEMKWRPRAVSSQPVENTEVLTDLLASGRGLILNFMHHGLQFAAAASLGRAGVPSHMAWADAYFPGGPPATAAQEAEWRAGTRHGAHAFCPSGAFEEMVGWVAAGEVVAMACDLPGSTPATFLGRRISAASGVARLARDTGAPVVPISASPDGFVTRFRVQDPIDSERFDTIEAIQAEIFRRHEPAVLAWPEAVQAPLERWALDPGPSPAGSTIAPS